MFAAKNDVRSISVSVQQYFIWRVKAITQSWLLFGLLSLCSFVAGALGVINACTGVLPKEWAPRLFSALLSLTHP